MESIANAMPMAEIFNSMKGSGIYPVELKLAKVIPLYQSGDASLFANYRPISFPDMDSNLVLVGNYMKGCR